MSENKDDTFTITDDDMKTLLNYAISDEDTQMYRNKYEQQVVAGKVDLETMFQYAWCLTHSRNPKCLKTASVLFQEIFKCGTEEVKRDSLFYLAVAELKQRKYISAKKYIESFLSVEKNNIQAIELKKYIERHLRKDGITGMAILGVIAVAGGAAAIVAGTAALGAALGFSIRKPK